ncbi:antibiotic biosynthesis monooxygenase [Xanthobacter dioxanivorans]|uniref:Antibiotic biosynthesis monooxygenase n=1 Tax=Xanthobacter dioxanivorans TaxID=2528964 RepID=A0A974PQD8_9HYPH|nr:antibiotic biosynthesis monooxygenase [Xanthobacter dioxanivorans]QRG07755.1 antibiotic biosynthesis monooxygenase [Xanthobacter dioxanivorans]
MTEAPAGSVTVVIQTRVLEGHEAAFAAWQEETQKVIAGFPGFIEQSIAPPAPPTQVDWVILQRFASTDAAVGWLNSGARLARLAGVTHMLAGRDDVHLVRDGASGVLPAPIAMVISTRLKPGQEAAYRAWEQRIAAAQSRAPGFQGYRFEAPIPGVQEDFLSILRFDTEANLNAWLLSPERKAMLAEAEPFTAEFHTRLARTGFDQWFGTTAGQAPAAWKQNMLVVLMLYPVVFLFGALVQTPLLQQGAKLPFPVALFVGNVVSVLLLSLLVPWVSRRFGWWLRPGSRWIDAVGAGVLVLLYGAMIAAFTLS